MQAVIRHPEGVRVGATAGEVALSIEVVISPSSRLTSEERIVLYQRGYHLRLLECLRAMHPGLRHALGDGLFDAFALDYITANPSHSYSLMNFNAGFAEHLEAHRPDRDGPSELWPEFLIDLALLERVFLEVYDGLGSEGEFLVPSSDLRGRPLDSWLTTIIEPTPSLRLLRSGFPVGSYLEAVRSGRRPELPLPGESFLAVSRRDYAVVLTELGASGHHLLSELLQGKLVGEAATAAGLGSRAARMLLLSWADRGFFRTVVCKGKRASSSGVVLPRRQVPSTT